MGADQFTPEGYEACRHCGHFMVAGGKYRSCDACRRQRVENARHLELVDLAQRKPARRRRRARKLTAAEREQKRVWNRARSRAIQRLVRVHHELYLMLLAEEKAKLGLDPSLDAREIRAVEA